MKTKKRTRLTRFLFGFLPLLLLASCVKENEYIPTGGGDGESMVKFAVQSPGAAAPQTRSITEAQENDVQTIDILVFQPGGGTYVYNARCDAADIITGSDARLKTFTIKLRQGNFDLVILANARDLFIPSALSGLSKADALATLEAVMPSGGRWPADGSAPFPMWGDVGAITIDDNTDLTGTNKVKINRMVARVDVNITGTAAANFQLTSVDVYNYNTSGTLVPDMTAWDTTDPDKPYATAPNVPASSVLTLGPIEYDGTEINTSLNNCIREIYLFEAENHTDALHTTAKGLQDRTCLVIGGIWDANGDGDFTNDGAPTYYRVDFSTGTGTAQTFIDVNRNHQYVFNVNKVSGYGYDDSYTAFISGPVNIESEIVVWNETDMEDVWVDGQYYYSVSPLQTEIWAAATTDNEIKVKTDYPTWSYELSDLPTPGDPAADITNVDWIDITSHIAGQGYTGAGTADYILYDVEKNETGGVRTAYIHVTAGRFTMTARIDQNAWYVDRVSVSPLGGLNPMGGTRTITIEGLFDDIDVRAWDLTSDELIITATVLSNVTSGLNNSAANILIDGRWGDRTVLYEYFSTQHNRWVTIITEEQESYFVGSISASQTRVLNPAAGGYRVTRPGQCPAVSIRITTVESSEDNNSGILSTGSIPTYPTLFGDIAVPANTARTTRNIYVQYKDPDPSSTDGWVTVLHVQQGGCYYTSNPVGYFELSQRGPHTSTQANQTCTNNGMRLPTTEQLNRYCISGFPMDTGVTGIITGYWMWGVAYNGSYWNYVTSDGLGIWGGDTNTPVYYRCVYQ